MKTHFHFEFEILVTIFSLLLTFFNINLLSQTPRYYNLNIGGSSNNFPFNVPAGERTVYLFLAGDFSHPTPVPAGVISKVYIYMSGTGGPNTFQWFLIKLGQSTISSLPPSSYNGPMDTVYFRSFATLSSIANQWLSFTLDKPYIYNPAKSLIIDISQVGYTGTGGMTLWNTMLTGARRNFYYCQGGVFIYAGQDASVLNFGFDLDTIPSAPNYYNTNAGTSNNVFPFAVTTGKEVQWLIRAGDFIQPSQAPSGYITSLYFWMGGAATNTFTGLTIKLGRTALTNLPASIYSGQ